MARRKAGSKGPGGPAGPKGPPDRDEGRDEGRDDGRGAGRDDGRGDGAPVRADEEQVTPPARIAAQVDRPVLPEAPPRPRTPSSPGSSGSIEIQFSSPRLPLAGDVADALGEPTDVSRAPTTEASLAAHSAVERPGPLDDDPFDAHDLTLEPEQARSSVRKVAKKAEVLVGQGVSKIGDGIGSIGEGVSKIGEKAATRVPVIGESVRQLGEGLSELGASLHDLPAVTQSKRGRILVRSMVVAFLLVFAWIAGIVLLQLRDSKKPDFRPLARKILIAVRDGRESAVWAEASPRFQEVVREQKFIDDMADMKRTLGAFREISAVNETMVTSSANGRVGRVALMLQFDKGRARANVSFHRDAGRWKLLGIAVDAPPELPITQESRKERSELPEEVVAGAIKVLQAGNLDKAVRPADSPATGRGREARPSGGGRDATAGDAELVKKSEEVWDQASGVFHSSASKAEFVRLQRERNQTLGNFVRVIEYRSGSKKYGDLSATFTGLVEYEQSGVVTVTLNFGRTEERAPWLLNSLKVVLPMPRPDEAGARDAADGRDDREDDRDEREDREDREDRDAAGEERPRTGRPRPRGNDASGGSAGSASNGSGTAGSGDGSASNGSGSASNGSGGGSASKGSGSAGNGSGSAGNGSGGSGSAGSGDGSAGSAAAPPPPPSPPPPSSS